MKFYKIHPKFLSVFIQVIICLLFFDAWTNGFSFMRGYIGNETKEIIIASVVLISCYVNVLILYPKFFKKQKFTLYILSTFCLILCISSMEYIYIIKDSIAIFNSMSSEFIFTHSIHVYGSIFTRNSLLLFASFMILLYKDALTSYHLRDRNYKWKTACLQNQSDLLFVNNENEKLKLTFQKLQINEHFLLNAMNPIYNAVMNKKENALDLVVNLRKMLIHSKNTNLLSQISLKEEILFLKDYIALSKARYSERKIVFEYPVNTDAIKISPMLFDIFINNAFKYGRRDKEGYIHICLRMEEESKLLFSCLNNIDEKSVKETNSTGRGLYLVKERLKLIYPFHQLDLKVENDCFMVYLLIDTHIVKYNSHV